MSSSQGSPRRGQWSAEDPSSRYGPLVGLVVVDVQNDFADPAGSLCVKGGSEIVPLVNAEIERALEAGGAIAGSPAVAGGRLVIGTDGGDLYCLGAK